MKGNKKVKKKNNKNENAPTFLESKKLEIHFFLLTIHIVTVQL